MGIAKAGDGCGRGCWHRREELGADEAVEGVIGEGEAAEDAGDLAGRLKGGGSRDEVGDIRTQGGDLLGRGKGFLLGVETVLTGVLVVEGSTTEICCHESSGREEF